MSYRHSVVKELKESLHRKRILFIVFAFCLFYLFYASQKASYSFTNSLSLFTFFLENLLPMTFPLLAVFIYLGKFSAELNHRFIFYTRTRMALGKTIISKFLVNFMLTFAVFFLYVFITFLYAFYIDPFFGLTEYFNPDMTVAEMEKDRLERHTFTQLLVYGDFIYGVLYSTWVGVNAAVWSSFGFLLLLVMNRSYVALTIPYLAYLAQVFFFGNPTLQPYRFSFSVFPYGFTQQEIWTAFIPLGALVIICLALSLYVRLKFRTLDNFL